MTTSLSGKIALVTGGSRGIGAATAKALAAQGATVAISYSTSADRADAVVAEIVAAGGKAAAFKADQGDVAQANGLVADVVAKFGKLDILVNNAALFVVGPVNGDDTSAFDRQYAVNVTGVIASIRAASKVIGEGGRIISLSSGIPTRVGGPYMADYAASKAAIEGFSKGAARDLGQAGVTVNVVAVGSVDTEMNPADGPYSDWQKAGNAFGRYGHPEEIAAVITFLASPAASFVTGAVIAADGGYGA